MPSWNILTLLKIKGIRWLHEPVFKPGNRNFVSVSGLKRADFWPFCIPVCDVESWEGAQQRLSTTRSVKLDSRKSLYQKKLFFFFNLSWSAGLSYILIHETNGNLK